MSQTSADFEFHTHDGNATRGTNAPEEGHVTNSDGQRLEVLAEVVRQGARQQIFVNWSSSMEIQLR